eukprot:7391572-Prymnesium_polylepis.1
MDVPPFAEPKLRNFVRHSSTATCPNVLVKTAQLRAARYLAHEYWSTAKRRHARHTRCSDDGRYAQTQLASARPRDRYPDSARNPLFPPSAAPQRDETQNALVRSPRSAARPCAFQAISVVKGCFLERMTASHTSRRW